MKADDKLEGNRTEFSVCLWLLTHNWDPFAAEMAQTLCKIISVEWAVTSSLTLLLHKFNLFNWGKYSVWLWRHKTNMGVFLGGSWMILWFERTKPPHVSLWEFMNIHNPLFFVGLKPDVYCVVSFFKAWSIIYVRLSTSIRYISILKHSVKYSYGWVWKCENTQNLQIWNQQFLPK